MQLVKREAKLKINVMFNVDTTVKNNRTSLFRQLISRRLWKQVTSQSLSTVAYTVSD